MERTALIPYWEVSQARMMIKWIKRDSALSVLSGMPGSAQGPSAMSAACLRVCTGGQVWQKDLGEIWNSS